MLVERIYLLNVPFVLSWKLHKIYMNNWHCQVWNSVVKLSLIFWEGISDNNNRTKNELETFFSFLMKQQGTITWFLKLKIVLKIVKILCLNAVKECIGNAFYSIIENKQVKIRKIKWKYVTKKYSHSNLKKKNQFYCAIYLYYFLQKLFFVIISKI